MTADIAGKTHVAFLFLFFSAKSHFLSVNDNHEITRIDMRRKNRFLLAAQQVGSFAGDPAQHLVFGID